MFGMFKKKVETTEKTVKIDGKTVEKKVSTSYTTSEYSKRTEFRSVSYGAVASRTFQNNGENRIMTSNTDAISAFEREFAGSKSSGQITKSYLSPPRSVQMDSKIAPSTSTPYVSPYRSSASTSGRLTTNTSLPPRPTYSLNSNLYNPSSSFQSISTTNGLRPLNSQQTPKITTSVLKPVTSSAIRPSVLNRPVGKVLVKNAVKDIPKPSSQKMGPKLEPGVVYIFNQEKFDDKEMKQDERIGSDKDVQALKETLGGRFKMTMRIFNDLRVKEIKAEVGRIQRQDYSKKSCLVIVILTHGTRHDFVCARDDKYSIDDEILFPMLQNKSLMNKPKIFIIQACKGDYATEQFVYTDAQPNRLSAPIQIAKLYSTFEGFLSYRGASGSLFIQILCENLKKNGSTKTVLEIMELTINQIVTQYDVRQVPTITHNLTIPLIFGAYV